MRFSRFWSRWFLWIMGATLGAPLLAEDGRFETAGLAVTWSDGVLTSITNRATGETFAGPGLPPLTGLRRLGGREVWNDTARQEDHSKGFTLRWTEGTEKTYLATEWAPTEEGDLRITQQARSAIPGLFGVQWGWVVPDTCEVLVPGNSGQRFAADTPLGRREFEYPISWEAQFVLVQGKQGGVLVFAEDNAQHFKTLSVEHVPGAFRLGFEGRCTAPFEPITEASSPAWRVHPYAGKWLVGAGFYRDWAERTFHLTKLAEQQPAWVKDIQFVVICGLEDEGLLQALAEQVDPRKTLLYVPNWRRDGYDRNYPDYTAVEGFGDQIQRAHAFGFRVMPHVNYFGCTPENPAYPALAPYHLTDPFSHQKLYWDWPRATPPIKFAYINPAARAWRELFVARMKEFCEQYRPDALHLDQTLGIFNDAQGLVDGLNCMEGSLELHRALRQALPDVALSGEGLNEITCRYEAFAQRHVYGINHAEGQYNDRLIGLAHPVSSALLAPYTTMYGYLGMSNPASVDLYFAWRAAYERWGMIPTLAFPSRESLEQPPPLVEALLQEARWFQQQEPTPDLDPASWDEGTLWAYRTRDGQPAAYRRSDTGVVLTWGQQVISRRLTGVTEARLPGSIDGWRAYDEARLLGLDPARSYVYTEAARDLNAFHVAALPPSGQVRRIGVRPEFAVMDLTDRRTQIADFLNFPGPSRAGERLRDGTIRQVQGLLFFSDTGTHITFQGEGLFAHPPWREEHVPAGTAAGVQGLGSAWVEFDVDLPAAGAPRFEAGVGLSSPEAARQSDGVTFRVSARPRQSATPAELTAELHAGGLVPQPLELDLAPLRGQPITLRLETSPGPAGSVHFDHALWTRPRLVSAEPFRERIELVSPQPPRQAFTAAGPVPLEALGANRYALEVPLPGVTFLLFTRPPAIQPPVDLETQPYSNALFYHRGGESPPAGFLRATPAAGRVGGVEKPGLFVHPPPQGENHVDFVLTLPEVPALRLTGWAGIRDGADPSNGVRFRIEVNGAERWSHDQHPGDPWTPWEVPLSDRAGQTVILSLITDARGDYTCDWAHWGEPRIVLARP
jgi:hypothetical protein